MPTYEYKCKACDHAFELFHSMKDAPKRKCPSCGKNALERLIGTGAAIIFKGSGFYETDYRTESYKKSAEAEKGSAETKVETKADKSSDSTAAAESKSTPETKPQTNSKAGSEAKTETKRVSSPESKPQPKSEPGGRKEPKPSAESQGKAGSRKK